MWCWCTWSRVPTLAMQAVSAQGSPETPSAMGSESRSKYELHSFKFTSIEDLVRSITPGGNRHQVRCLLRTPIML
jgi:hypothetical protein